MLIFFYWAKQATHELEVNFGRLVWTRLTIKVETRLDSSYVEFESRRVKSLVTRLARVFQILISGPPMVN
jgi:hypothetical protein